jgi:NitT/TauT family transport system substrate-binding protein
MTASRVLQLAVPDLISNSYFPAVAAVELGLLAQEGVEAELQLLFPVTTAVRRLVEGEIDLLAGAAHAPLYLEPRWNAVQLAASLAQHMYWFLVVGPDSPVRPGDLPWLSGVRIGAAPGPDIGLRQLLIETGGPLEDRGIELVPVPGASAQSVSFGVTAADALAAGTIDAFWANGMGAEVAVRRGGRVIHDARRDGLPGADYTFPALMVTRRMAAQEPETVRAAARAIGRAQQALREDPAVAARIGGRLFPDMEASLISGIISRDLPWYTPEITPGAVAGLNSFAQSAGLLTDSARYEDVVATCAVDAWHVQGTSEPVQ